MRLGQLARQLEIKSEKIVQFLEEEKGITIKSHPNSKIDDELIPTVTEQFKPVKEEPQEEETTEETEAIIEEPSKPTEVEDVPKEELVKEPEHIETKKTTVVEPKIIGKIDLPNKKDIQVEIDGVVYDQEFLDQKKKDELAAQREQKALEKEAKKKEEQERKQKALEKRKLEEERQAMLAQEKNNALTAEEEKKKQAILKAQQERERKLEENRKKRQKEFYEQQLKEQKKAIASKKKETKPQKEDEVAVTSPIEEPKETNVIKRFIKWLNT